MTADYVTLTFVLERAEQLFRYSAIVSIVAWRVNWLTLVSRTAPNILQF